jgi:hypothetical protein
MNVMLLVAPDPEQDQEASERAARDWLGRQSARHRISLTIDGDTIELESASAAERRDLVDAYIRRHASA